MASASHPMDMIPVCPTCLEAHRTDRNYTEQLRSSTNGCLEPQVHNDHENWPLAVLNEISGCLETVRPMPEVTLSGKFIMCRNLTSNRRGRVCLKSQCTYAHTKLERRAWNRALRKSTGSRSNPRSSSYLQVISSVSEPLSRPPPNRSTTKLQHEWDYQLPPLAQLNQRLLEAPLTYDNYQDKFHVLLYHEEHEHKKVLKERCDGVYNTTYQSVDGIVHGTIEGMISTQVAYVRQTAASVKLSLPASMRTPAHTIKADLELANLSHEQADDTVYFTIVDTCHIQIIKRYCPNLSRSTMSLCCTVQFVLRHQHFASFHKSLDNLQPHVISKLVPRSVDLNFSLKEIGNLLRPNIKELKPKLDSEYQLIALKKVLGCSSNAIFLVTGPFGTGKTMLLATAAYNFLMIPDIKARVLICTCHTQSADAYINDYFGPMVDRRILNGNALLRLIGKSNPTTHVKSSYYWCVKSSESADIRELKQKQLVVTTFISTQQLKGATYTHILIDEGAQGREPEAVAPLALADKHTKIIVAGDHLQVGPQVLVLGEKAQKHGLATSLLQRMHGHYMSNAPSTKHLTSILLTNYRCHDTILRLPSALFFESTLQARSTAKLHSSCKSALEFVCTSLDQSKLCNCPDFNDMEAVILLEQVEHYLSDWPTAEWGPKDYSKICIMSPSPTQINKIYQHLRSDAFSHLKGIAVLKSYALQGREFRAVFISALEGTTESGAAFNPAISICDRYVFNTIITRAQSLVVCVGNPFLLLSIEAHSGQEHMQCWKEYLKRCLEVSSLKISPQCREAFGDCQSAIQALYLKVFGDLQSFLASPQRKIDGSYGDSILDAYKRAFQSLPQCRSLKVTLGRIANGDTGYTVEEDKEIVSENEELVASSDPRSIECYLQCDTYRLSWAVPIDPNQDSIKIQGIDNRRKAFDGARVQVSLYEDIERSGRVTKIVKQGPDRQFICTVDAYNSIMFNPIDQKNPRFVNLPGLSRGLLLKAGNVKTIKKELEVKQHSVAVFDCASFSMPSKRDDEEESCDLEIPQIKDVIPLSIARRLLFVVWYLSWEPNKRYPLGVVVAALPRGLTFFHAERILCTRYSISAPNVEITPIIEKEISATPRAVDMENIYKDALVIEQLDVAFSVECLGKSKDGVTQYALGVYVPNVARFLAMGSDIDKLACDRGTSLRNCGPDYKQHPMLPPSAVTKWSFSYGEPQNAISVYCRVQCIDGKVSLYPETTTIKESCVHPAIPLSFSEVQKILEKQFVEGYGSLKGDTKEGKIGVLYLLAKHLCCMRLQCDVPLFSTSSVEEFPHARFLVNELMVWMNRTVAEYMLSNDSSFPSVLHKQRKPNSSQFASALEKHVSVLPFHPFLKALYQKSPLNQPTEPFILEQGCFKELYGALVQKVFVKASEILSVFQSQPQITVIRKELSVTEPNHEYFCSSVLQHLCPLKVSMQDERVWPYAHHGLHCLSSHITSPLKSYLDIIAQRLLLNALNNKVQFAYTPEEITSLCESCQIKQDNAAHCEQSINQLNIALSLAEYAQPFLAFVGTIKETSEPVSKNTNKKGRLQLVFPDPALQWLEENQCTVTLGSVACGNSRIAVHKGSFISTFSVKMTSFLHTSPTNFYRESACHISRGDTTVNDDETKRMVFMVPNSDAKHSTLVKKPFIVRPNSTVVSIPEKDWSSVEQFMKSPCEATGMPLLKVLGEFPTDKVSGSKETILEEDTDEFLSVIKDSSMWLYEGQFSIKPYRMLKVWLSASYTRPLLIPTIQLLEVAPFLNICIQHNTAPASCFASPILSNASKIKYNSIKEYVSLWEDVVLAEASVQSIKEAEMKIIYDVQLKWPTLKQPETSLDDVYFVPDDEIALHLTDELLKMSKDFFGFDVGDLVCVRYKVPLSCKLFNVNYGLKEDKGYAVFHLVVYEVDTTHIYLKFASPQTTRISAYMKDYLKDDPYCEMQLISLNVSHRRVYKSLRSLLLPRYITNISDLVFRIALGNVAAHGASAIDGRAVKDFKQEYNNDQRILQLWPLSRSSRSLNDSQIHSISLAMNNRFQLIQGPPGTGKSVTGAHLAYAFYCKNESNKVTRSAGADKRIKCVLVCGPSNKSVDVVLDLLLQLNDPKLCLLRIYGNSIERKDFIGPYYNKEVFTDIITDQKCQSGHRPYALHWKIRSSKCSKHKAILEMDKKFTDLANKNKIPSPSSMDEYRRITRLAEDEILQSGHHIVLCTCNEANSFRVTRNIAPVQVIIDEAAMATEPESMAAIKLASERVTLIGDHMQLQPVIDCRQAADFGLGTSLFERYASPPQKKSAPVETEQRHFLRLNTQYRMHPKICEIPSKMFYDNELETDYNSTPDCVIKDFWPKGPNFPLAFCDVVGREGGAVSGNKKSSLFSKSNAVEADKVTKIVKVMHKKGISKDQIAVLTPYTSQKEVICNALGNQGFSEITVQTVTESQGREFGFVILSTVRSQPWHTISNKRAVQPDRKWLLDHIGFVANRHQICVGITRAKHGLIIVGNKTLLRYDDTWEKLIKIYSDKGYIKSDREFPSV